LKAALNPASSDYLYYVRNPDRDDGAHNFYNNSHDFETGVQALRNWERERDLEEQKRK
jgi:cell division protein YceG involved in septum cleavage